MWHSPRTAALPALAPRVARSQRPAWLPVRYQGRCPLAGEGAVSAEHGTLVCVCRQRGAAVFTGAGARLFLHFSDTAPTQVRFRHHGSGFLVLATFAPEEPRIVTTLIGRNLFWAARGRHRRRAAAALAANALEDSESSRNQRSTVATAPIRHTSTRNGIVREWTCRRWRRGVEPVPGDLWDRSRWECVQSNSNTDELPARKRAHCATASRCAFTAG